MALPEDCVTSFAPAAARDPRQPRRAAIVAALAVVLGSAIYTPAVLAQSPPVLTGKWQLACTGRHGKERQVALAIAQQGATLSGSYAAARGSGQLRGSVRGDQVTLELEGRRRSANFTGTTTGKTLQIHTAKGISCTATRA